MMKFDVGSSYPVIKDEDILNLPIPLINSELQQMIKAKVMQSQAAQSESKRLLTAAKQAVEAAIGS